jgi:hypothetical protein
MSCYHNVDKISDSSVQHESENEMNSGSKTYIYIYSNDRICKHFAVILCFGFLVVVQQKTKWKMSGINI